MAEKRCYKNIFFRYVSISFAERILLISRAFPVERSTIKMIANALLFFKKQFRLLLWLQFRFSFSGLFSIRYIVY